MTGGVFKLHSEVIIHFTDLIYAENQAKFIIFGIGINYGTDDRELPKQLCWNLRTAL